MLGIKNGKGLLNGGGSVKSTNNKLRNAYSKTSKNSNNKKLQKKKCWLNIVLLGWCSIQCLDAWRNEVGVVGTYCKFICCKDR